MKEGISIIELTPALSLEKGKEVSKKMYEKGLISIQSSKKYPAKGFIGESIQLVGKYSKNRRSW